MLKSCTLLLLLVGGSVVMDLCAASIQRALAERRVERQAEEAITQAGGEVILLSYSPFDWLWVALLGDDPYLRVGWVGFVDGRLTDERMQHLAERHLAQCAELRSVSFQNESRLTGKGLKHLKKVPQLEEVRICDVPLEDADLDELQGLTHIRTLTLTKTNVTPAGAGKLQASLPTCVVMVDCVNGDRYIYRGEIEK